MKKFLGLILAVVMIASCFSVALADEIPEAHLNWLSWMTKGEDEPTIKAFMEKYPQVKVEVMAIDGTNYATDLITRCLGGDVPDVFLAQTNAINELVANGFIQPIDGLAGVDKQQANESIQNLLSRDGKTYGYAINGGKGSRFVYYNKAMFAEAGIEKEPETYEEFEAICAKLKEAGIDPLITPAGDTWNANYFANSFMVVNTVNLGMSKGTELALLKGEAKMSDLYGDMFRKMKEFYDNGWISEGGLSMGWEAGTQYFVDGGAAMICTGNWLPGSTPIQEAPEDFEYGAFILPGIPANDGMCYDTVGTDRCIFLSANPSSPEAAKALFEYFISDEVLYEYLTRQGLTGVNLEVPVAEVFQGPMDTLANGKYVLTTDLGLPDMPSGYAPNLSQYCADVFSGASVEELLAKLDADFDAAMSTVDVESYIAAIEAK